MTVAETQPSSNFSAGAEAGVGVRLTPHPSRAAVIGEMHARPFRPLPTPSRILHFVFTNTPAATSAMRQALADYCRERGLPAPQAGAKHHYVTLADGALRWECHGEFATYSWEVAGLDRAPFDRPASSLASGMTALPQPGPFLAAVDLQLMTDDGSMRCDDYFDPAALAASVAADGAALIASDFKVTADGFVRMLVLDRGLGVVRAGALCQRLLELETYRCLALLGLPEAQRLAPDVQRIEARLTEITRDMRTTEGLESNSALLAQLTALAADLEAGAAASFYRFGASRAYDNIVQGRLQAIREAPLPGQSTLASFLARRIGPAMRTCQSIEERQASLSEKLSRAAQLLRTRVDIELENQNRALLSAMNERARLQLRLQQTVEGLSIAAISYYIVGLLGYLFKGAHDFGLQLDPVIATGISAPAVVVIVAAIVWRIRRAHREDHSAAAAGTVEGKHEAS